jgi:hypothetical protein
MLVQDTGFTRWLHADGGVLPFADADEALRQLDLLNGAYERHCAMARDVTWEYFRAPKVLSRLLDAAI